MICLYLVSVRVGRKISSSYEHVDRFQFLLNKQTKSSKSNEMASSLHQNAIEKLHINSENQEKDMVEILEGPHQRHTSYDSLV
jgi:hypothetical protein